MVNLVGIDVYIVIFNIMQFQTERILRQFCPILSTIPSATQSYLIIIKSIMVENHKNAPSHPPCSI